MRPVYDTFLFSTELDLLEIRLHELRDVVDFHVIIEGVETFTGALKPLHYRDNAARFSEFARKIIHVVVADAPREGPWEREHHQRNAMGRVTYPGDALVLIGDVDEIPHAEIVRNLGDCHEPVILGMRFGQYWLDRELIGIQFAHCTRAISIQGLQRQSSASSVRRRAEGLVIVNAGWHMSWMGGVGTVRTKLESFSHQEYNRPELKTDKFLTLTIDNVLPINGGESGCEVRVVPMNELPRYVQENPAKFVHMMKGSK